MEDSRRRETRMSKRETAGLFGVSLSLVKRFTRMEREGDSLAPKKPPGRPPKGSDATRRLLEADLAERPAASVPDRRRYPEGITGESVSDSTLRRLVKRLGLIAEKKITPRLRAWRRVPEGDPAGVGPSRCSQASS
jgi:transposase